MENIRTLILVLLVLTLSCNAKEKGRNTSDDFLAKELNSSEKKQKKNIPHDALPIVYFDHLYINGSSDSINGNFLFDTGALGFFFDSTYYANNKFHYTNLYTAYLSGAGNNAQKIEVIKDTVGLKIGKNFYRANNVPIIQLKPIVGDYADGLIGLQYFHNSVMEINYEEEYIRLFQSIDSVDISSYSRIKLEKKDNRLLIPLQVEINDIITVEGKFLLDFGSGTSVSITSPIAKKYDLTKNIEKKTLYYTKYGGVGGESSSYEFMSTSLTIGDFVLNKVTMDFSIDKRGALSSDLYMGVLGNDIYERFNVIIDFVNNYLFIKPNSKFKDSFEFSKLGFSFVDRSQTLNSWIITGIYEGANAQKQGLKIDDKIIEVNGIAVNQINQKSKSEYLNKYPNLELTILRNDIQKNIKLNLAAIQ